MYEHQSTYSPNSPVRFLIYLAQEYQMVIEKAERKKLFVEFGLEEEER